MATNSLRTSIQSLPETFPQNSFALSSSIHSGREAESSAHKGFSILAIEVLGELGDAFLGDSGGGSGGEAALGSESRSDSASGAGFGVG